MERVTNKEILEKVEALQHDLSHKELSQKLDALSSTVSALQRNAADKETMKRLSQDSKKSVVVIYVALALAYLGIGVTILLASLNLVTFQYSILFGVFFGGSIILALLAYTKRKEVHK
ncbi:MAG TPA: hypothetical protein VMT57_03260 [Candidatus Thermoplasmatota archaeon]|nr:hypothetical protein [Candidatus Thermoplasmatota archaeon]